MPHHESWEPTRRAFKGREGSDISGKGKVLGKKKSGRIIKRKRRDVLEGREGGAQRED